MKIALISPGDLPIPAIRGGAIETLSTHIINQNEIEKKLQIVLYTAYDYDAIKISDKYQNTITKTIKLGNYHSKIFDFFQFGIRVISLKKIPRQSYFIKKVVRDLKNHEFDYIIVEGNYNQILHIPKKYHQKIILHMHTDYLFPTTKHATKIFSACNKILVVSEYLKRSIARIDPANDNKIIVYKNSINTNYFGLAQFSEFREEFRNRHHINEKDVVVIYCGRLDYGKGVKELLLAVKSIPDCKLLIVGSSWFSSAKKTQYVDELEVISKEINNRVFFTGFMPNNEVGKYYAVADIGCFPSICNEAAGLVIIEAMASGLPIVTTSQGGIPEYAPLDSCIYVQVGDDLAIHLKKEIEDLISNPNKRITMASHAKENAKLYNVDSYYANLLKLLTY